MTQYTDRGLREIASGLREAKAIIARKRSELRHQIGVLEAEFSALGKIEASCGCAVDVLGIATEEREANKK